MSLRKPKSRAALKQPDSAAEAARQRRDRDRHAADFTYDWVDEDEIAIWAQVLSETDADNELGSAKIRAVSDFAPIHERIKRGPKRRRDIVREGWAYHVSRWPLLGLVFSLIGLEFLGYLFVRQLVNLIEYVSSWHGTRGRLRLALRSAKTYDEWKSTALTLDKYLHYDDWKKSPPNAYYDSQLVRRVLRALRDLRTQGDVEGVRAVLDVAVRSNFAGVENFHLYSETFYGTKELIEEFVQEVATSLEYVSCLPEAVLSDEEKARFFRHCSKNFGATALCLSGGASFGYYHFGVVRAMLDTNMLPKVITGTSAGALVAALVGTRTDDELRQLIKPELADRINACYESFTGWVRRWWRTGARFDTLDWARKCSFFSMGSMTFKEAYERTGRILNVSVIPYDTHSPTKLLNYMTAPHCVIYTAVIASAAVPGILNPISLMTKEKDGRVRGWDFEGKHKDGSLRVDIPLQSLQLMYNVNFSIVSQVNPHLHLFSFSPRGSPGRPVTHRRGKGWRGGFFLSAAEQFLKLELMKNFRVIRDLELMPELAGQNWSAVFLQRFEGTVTITPKSRIRDWFRLLTDPDRKELARMINVGQSVAWPKIHMIENHITIERQIDAGRDKAYAALAQQPLRRGSSFDFASPPPPPVTGSASTSEAPSVFEDAVETAATSEDEDAPSAANGHSKQRDEETRRRQILTRLGLRHASESSGRDYRYPQQEDDDESADENEAARRTIDRLSLESRSPRYVSRNSSLRKLSPALSRDHKPYMTFGDRVDTTDEDADVYTDAHGETSDDS